MTTRHTGKNRIAAFPFLAIVVSLPASGSNLKQTAPEPAQMILAVGVAVVAILWLDIPQAIGLLGKKVKST